MDYLGGKAACVLRSDAFDAFANFMDTPLHDAGRVLLRGVEHRQAEGGVLLSLANSSAPAANDMIDLDPSSLIKFVRRLADHNLVDKNKNKQGTFLDELRTYAK